MGKIRVMGEGGLRPGIGRMAGRVVANGRLGGLGGRGFRVRSEARAGLEGGGGTEVAPGRLGLGNAEIS